MDSYNPPKPPSHYSYVIAANPIDHSLRQPPFGLNISFTPNPDSIKKPTYQELGLPPRVIYAQDDFRGNGDVTDGFTVQDSDTVVFLVGPSYLWGRPFLNGDWMSSSI